MLYFWHRCVLKSECRSSSSELVTTTTEAGTWGVRLADGGHDYDYDNIAGTSTAVGVCEWSAHLGVRDGEERVCCRTSNIIKSVSQSIDTIPPLIQSSKCEDFDGFR